VRVGAEDKKKTTIAVVLFAVALLAVVYELWPSSSSTPTPRASVAKEANGKGPRPVFSKLDPSLRIDLLKGSEEVAYEGSGRDIFHAQAEPKPDVNEEKADDPRVTKEQAPPVPPTPTIPLKFYGFASANNKKQIFLSQNDDIFVAKEGDIVKGRYKIVHVNPTSVEIQDVLANFSQQIPLSVPNS
jgi:hypothetical protein